MRVVGEAGLVPDGMVARSAHLASEVDLTDIAASFPHNTVRGASAEVRFTVR